MKKRTVRHYIEDILEAMTNAEMFVRHMTYEEFKTDTKTLYALIRAIEVMGEAAKHIPDTVRKEFPDIPWRDIAGMRDRLIHGYFQIESERVWNVVKKDIPQLKPLIKAVLLYVLENDL